MENKKRQCTWKDYYSWNKYVSLLYKKFRRFLTMIIKNWIDMIKLKHAKLFEPCLKSCNIILFTIFTKIHIIDKPNIKAISCIFVISSSRSTKNYQLFFMKPFLNEERLPLFHVQKIKHLWNYFLILRTKKL